MRNVQQIVDGLPTDRREKIVARSRELIAEELALRQLRQARDLTQQKMARLLEIDQAGVSKIEQRSDMLISTMRSYVEAMGGSLRMIAEFSDGRIELANLGEVGAQRPKKQSKSSATGAPARSDRK